jgi:hypothetical protein
MGHADTPSNGGLVSHFPDISTIMLAGVLLKAPELPWERRVAWRPTPGQKNAFNDTLTRGIKWSREIEELFRFEIRKQTGRVVATGVWNRTAAGRARGTRHGLDRRPESRQDSRRRIGCRGRSRALEKCTTHGASTTRVSSGKALGTSTAHRAHSAH